MRRVVPALAMLVALCESASADPMTLDFSWHDARGCVTLFPNPEIRLRNIPAGAKLLLITLRQGTREMGGQELPVPPNGILQFGTIRTFGPCNPGIYQWTAQVRSSTGEILSEAHQARFYPTDELASEKPNGFKRDSVARWGTFPDKHTFVSSHTRPHVRSHLSMTYSPTSPTLKSGLE